MATPSQKFALTVTDAHEAMEYLYYQLTKLEKDFTSFFELQHWWL